MIDVDIISYRKLSFAHKFGFAVRDLLMLRAILDSKCVSRVRWFERPDTIADIFDRRAVPQNNGNFTAPTVFDFQLIEIMTKRRLRAKQSFNLYGDQLNTTNIFQKRILLDFNPFYIPRENIFENTIYWYDAIDNFKLHNRFNEKQRSAVNEKYNYVAKKADVITAVSGKALSAFGKGDVLENRLLKSEWLNAISDSSLLFDFGFVGFITDKFDVQFVERLSQAGYSVLLAGKAYNTQILRHLKRIPRVKYFGAFSSNQVQSIISRFRVGIIPYRADKLHDESPIKFFQYLCMGRPIMQSTRFGVSEERYRAFVHYYDLNNFVNAIEFYENVKLNFSEIRAEIVKRAQVDGGMFWEDAIDSILQRVIAI